MQAKLLRVLEEGEIERIGSGKPTSVDVRLVVATHRNLEELVASGHFRRDLYHRVVVFPVTLPPLRSRLEDLPALVHHFATQVCAQNNWKPIHFSQEAIQALTRYPWPGNIRELRNLVERLLLLAGETVTATDVTSTLPTSKHHQPAATANTTAGQTAEGPLADRVAAYERSQVLAELASHQGNITRAARALGLERSHLYKKCQQLNIDLESLPGR